MRSTEVTSVGSVEAINCFDSIQLTGYGASLRIPNRMEMHSVRSSFFHLAHRLASLEVTFHRDTVIHASVFRRYWGKLDVADLRFMFIALLL